MEKRKYNLSAIMTNAWIMFKAKDKETFSAALKESWKNEKGKLDKNKQRESVMRTVYKISYETRKRHLDIPVEDVQQELMIAAFKAVDNYDAANDKGCSLNTYVMQRVRFAAIDLQRSHFKKDHPNETIVTDFETDHTDLCYDDTEHTECKLQLDIVENKLEKLQHKNKVQYNAYVIFKLMRTGYTQKECAEKLHITEGRVSQIFNDAIKVLGSK